MSKTKSFTKIKKIKLTQLALLILISAIFLFLLLLINGCKIAAAETMCDKPLGKTPTPKIISVVQAQAIAGLSS